MKNGKRSETRQTRRTESDNSGPVCGNQDCEELCAEAYYDAALSLRLDPAETIHKTIERELHCLPAATGDGRACRFGFVPASDFLVLSEKKRKRITRSSTSFVPASTSAKSVRNWKAPASRPKSGPMKKR